MLGLKCRALTFLSPLPGWGSFDSEEECCEPGKGFSDGCGAADVVEVLPEEDPISGTEPGVEGKTPRQ